MKNVLAFGAGIQSTCLLLLAIEGAIKRPDYCIFSDTGWEPEKVYKHCEFCFKIGEKAGIKMVKVSNGNIKKDLKKSMKDSTRFASIPLFVLGQDGNKTILRRQCTNEYKIKPMYEYFRREILGLKFRQHAPKHPVITNWLGITQDEIMRVKDSRDKWVLNEYPFLNWGEKFFDKNWHRYHCENWLRENYPELDVPKSACIICPYRDNKGWREIKENKEEFDEAIEFDEACRNGLGKQDTLDGSLYLHRSCKPLGEVDLRSDEEKGQANMFNNECEGHCGI